jgi:hypothetical protein
MATLNITEYLVGGPLNADQALPVPPVAKDTLTYAAKTESATTFVGNRVRLVASANCYVQFGETVDATTDDILLVANVPQVFAVTPGHKLDAWDGTTV